ncbi:MAG: hypothetical protein JWP87_2875 [Labilithrix sp.]|nr:hypothetical protein [Labilithrix sp.]
MLARLSAVSFVSVSLLFGVVTLAPSTGGCGRAVEPANRPIDRCVHSCTARVSRECSADECARGCEFILDRLLEKEGDNVIACVARAPRRCSDIVWADCAARIGVHADGGPPEPPPPTDEE